MQWYMDVVLQLLERSGDFVSDEIWHRAVQLVTNNPSMQEYAARNVAESLKRGAAHEVGAGAGAGVVAGAEAGRGWRLAARDKAGMAALWGRR